MIKITQAILLFLAVATPTLGIRFTFTMQPQSRRCFWEILTQSTPFHFKVEGSSDMFEISMNHHDGTALVVNKRSNPTKKIDSYASVTGQYSFCILNHDLTPQRMTYQLFQGLQLSDLGSLPKKQDSKVIDQRVDEINAIYQTVKEQESYSRTVNEYNMQLQKLVSFKSVGFVFLSITVVLIISFLHYLEIKRVLRTRKII